MATTSSRGGTEYDLTRVVILREETYLDPFLSAVQTNSDATLSSETIVMVASNPPLAAAVRERDGAARVVECPVDLGTAVAWNLAVGAARAPTIALLHEDTIVTPGWERALVDRVDAGSVGVVGPRLSNLDGSLQCTGWMMFDDGRCAPFDDRVTAALREAARPNGALDVDLVSSACMLFSVATWAAVGGFDEQFFPAVGVDVDFCLAVRSLGLRTICDESIEVVHASGAMVRPGSRDADATLREFLIQRNHRLLGQKWAAALAGRPRFPRNDEELIDAVRWWVDARRGERATSAPVAPPERSITAGQPLADDDVPPGVSERARRQRAAVTAECRTWNLAKPAPKVLVIVPTHDHASTLDIAVDSALAQSHADLEVVIIGDGVGDDTREVARSLVARDDRVRFVDRPKSSGRNERGRHEVIMESDADVVTYLGDDDLFFGEHVAEMVDLLATHDFAHPFPIFIDPDERLVAYATDLSDPACVEWHLDPEFNTIGLTGAAHTTAAYRRLPHGWQEPPPGRWSDHYFWGQIFRQPAIRLVTSARSTVVKAPASQHVGLSGDERRALLQRWWTRVQDPGFAVTWAEMTADAIRRAAATNHMWVARHHRTIGELQERLDAALSDNAGRNCDGGAVRT